MAIFAGIVESLAVVRGSCVSTETVPVTMRPAMKSAVSSIVGLVSHMLVENELQVQGQGISKEASYSFDRQRLQLQEIEKVNQPS